MSAAAAARSPLDRAGEWVAAQAGWRRRVLAACLGALAAAALPPVYALPLLLPAFAGFLWLIDGSRGWRAAFAAGWWFGLGHFVAGVYWITISLLVDAAQFAWIIPFALLGICGYLALFPALAAVLVRLSRATGAGRVPALAAAWTAAEYLRGVALGGFPWNMQGTVWTFSDTMIQGAALFGTLGLGLVTVAAAALPAAFAQPDVRGLPPARGRWPVLIATAAALAGLWIFGAVRLGGAGDATVPGVMLRIVQPNIAQERKWRPELRAENLRRHLRLTKSPGFDRISHVIWPEAAAPFALSTAPRARAAIAAVAPAGGLVIVGAPRRSLPGQRPIRLWNSLYAIDRKGDMVAVYDKQRLVPFGEYLPLRGLFAYLGIDKITPGSIDFSAGPDGRVLDLPGLPPVRPLICYEVIFPGRVVPAGRRPGWLLNVTNDAWFGRSSGPYQHFASARLRAVEEGLPIVRAANTGISAVVDAHGRVRASLGLGREGVIDAALPVALAGLTPFARHGNLIPWGLIVLAGGIAWPLSRRRRATAVTTSA